MLEVQHVTKTFKSLKAVNDLSLQVGEGQIYALLGTNGAGKTTLMKMCITVLNPTYGTILLDGESIFDNPIKTKAKIGYVPETPYFYQKLTGEEFLRFVGKIREVEGLDRKIAAFGRMFAIEDFLSTEMGAYSKGMKQKISIITAIIHEPKYLLLDEPTSGLDPMFGSKVKSIIVKEREKGKGVLISTHITSNAEEVADRVGIIHKGQLLAEGSPKEIMDSTSTNSLEDAFIKLVGGKPELAPQKVESGPDSQGD
jgi:ABC-2 type transport system ATP-binding protein